MRARIQAACARTQRDPAAVTLIGVTKGCPVEAIEQALALGVTDLGENRVQEAREKHTVLGSRLKVQGRFLEPRTLNLEPRVKWHLIGHLQRNKITHALEQFDVIHSVDSIELIEALERHRLQTEQRTRVHSPQSIVHSQTRPVDIFVQVNVSGEETKFGCRPEETKALAAAVSRSSHLKLAGLMTIAPFSDDAEAARPVFRALRLLRDNLQETLNTQSPSHAVTQSLHLSMGMSHDFEVAIEEGADVVRIGTAIFGTRH